MIRRPSAGVLGRVGVTGAALLLAAACARQGSPPGGIQDRVPPVVVSVEPDTFARVQPGLDELKIRFNERISEQPVNGRLDDVVQISPEVPQIRVSHDRTGLDVKIPGGLRPGVTYAIRVRPVLRDMFGNAMVAPFEWVVSTGGSFTPNAVVGQVWDRVTGEFLSDVRVVLTPVAGTASGDTIRYAAVTGDEGLYALRYLEPGDFRLLAFQDRNGDRIPDAAEAFGRASGGVGEADTVFLSVPILLPDTSAAVLVGAQPLDSTVVRLRFDDILDPEASLDGIGIEFAPDSGVTIPDTVTLPGVAQRFHEYRWTRVRDSTRAAADSLFRARVEELAAAGDSAAADSLRSRGAPPVPGADDRGPQRSGPQPPGGRLPDGSPLPSNTVVLVLDRSLPRDLGVEVRVSGAVNVNGLPGGGGTAGLLWAPPVDSASADSLAADSLATDSLLAPDTAAVPDSVALPDTAGVVLPGAVRPLLPSRRR